MAIINKYIEEEWFMKQQINGYKFDIEIYEL